MPKFLGMDIVNGLPQIGGGVNLHVADYKGPKASDYAADQKRIDDAIAQYQAKINKSIEESYAKGVDYITGYNQGAERSAQAGTDVSMAGMGLAASPIAAALKRQYAADTARTRSSQLAGLTAEKANAKTSAELSGMGMGVGALTSGIQNFRSAQAQYGLAQNAANQKVVSDIASGMGSLAKTFKDTGSKALSAGAV